MDKPITNVQPDKPLDKWTVTELKNELKARNLAQGGVKADLIERLQKSMSVQEEENQVAGEEEAPGAGDDAMEEHAEPAAAVENIEEMVEAENGAEADQPAEGADGEDAEEQVEDETATGQETAIEPESTTPSKPEVVKEPEPPQEWEVSDIPEEWIPRPLFKVKNLPEEVTSDEVKELLVSIGLPVHNVTLDDGSKGQAYVRLNSPALPWKLSKEELETPLFTPTLPAKPAPEATEEVAAPATEDAEKEKAPEAKAETVVAKKPVINLADGRMQGDVVLMGKYYVQKLNEISSSLELKDKKLTFEWPSNSMTLFIGNLADDDDEKLKTEMAEYGSVERCFIMRNSFNLSKEYAFVEFSLPSSFTKAKAALESKSRQQHQAMLQKKKTPASTPKKTDTSTKPVDASAAQEEKADTSAKVAEDSKEEDVKKEDENVEAKPAEEDVAEDKKEEPVAMEADEPKTSQKAEEEEKPAKNIRAEDATTRTVASLYSKNLYISNLKAGFKDEKVLAEVLGQFGQVASCSIAKNMATGQPRDFAFVEYKRSDHADIALRALDGEEHPVLGKITVTFVNPTKLDRRPISRPGNTGRGMPAMRGGRFSGDRGMYGPGRGMGGYPGRGGPFMGRGMPARGFPGRGPMPMNAAAGRGMAGRGYMPARGSPYGGGYGSPMSQPVVPNRMAEMQMRQVRAQTMQYQQQLAAAHQQQQQMQQQLRAMQQQALRAQQEAQQAAQQAAMLANRVKQEAEAKRAAEARAAAAAAASARYSQQSYGYGGSSTAAQPAAATTGASTGYGSTGYGQSSYGTAANNGPSSYGTGYGSTQQSYGTQSTGYGTQTGSAAAQPTQTGYGTSQTGYGTSSGYTTQQPAQTGYGSTAAAGTGYGSSAGTGYGSQTGYGTTQSATGYGSQAATGYGSQSGYGTTAAATPATQQGYGQTGTGGYSSGGGYQQQAAGYGVGQKRDGDYGTSTGYGSQQQSTGYGAYNRGAQDFKRSRY